MKAYVNMSDYWVNERNKRALDDLVWRVMENEKGAPFDLMGFLDDQYIETWQAYRLRGVVAQALLKGDLSLLRDEVESRLRAKLEGSEAVERRAEEIATEE